MNLMTPRSPDGIDEASIERLVHRFYDKARADSELGPIFAAVVEDWDEHFRTLTAFWSSIALGTDGYAGRPLPAHVNIGIQPQHFTRWLALFSETAREVFPPDAAGFFVARAEKIARSFEMGISFHQR